MISELIGIHDAKSLCEGFNRGAARAMGDVLIFVMTTFRLCTPTLASVCLASREADVVGLAGGYATGEWRLASRGAPHLVGQICTGRRGRKGFSITRWVLHEADATVQWRSTACGWPCIVACGNAALR